MGAGGVGGRGGAGLLALSVTALMLTGSGPRTHLSPLAIVVMQKTAGLNDDADITRGGRTFF